MDKREIRAYFDALAPSWDSDCLHDDAVIDAIFDNAAIAAGQAVLDVACGTGVVIGDYLRRDVAHVTAIDLSPRMIDAARRKYDDPRVTFLCGDVEETSFDGLFDRVMVYNAFPHFPEPQRVIRTLAGLLKSGGALSIAHGMSREKLNAHHNGSARHVSLGLMDADALAGLMSPYLRVTVKCSDETMYQVVGMKE